MYILLFSIKHAKRLMNQKLKIFNTYKAISRQFAKLI